MKLCIIYNFAQHYRASIFRRISQTYECDFVFGDSMSDVRKMDYKQLHGKVTETHTRRFAGAWYWQPGIISLLQKPYTHYILLGETRAISTWVFALLARLFHPKKNVYFWSHGWYGKESRTEAKLKKLFFKLPNGGVFLYGNYARNLMIKEGFNTDKLFTIHNSLNYEEQINVRKLLSVKPIYKEHFGNDNPNLFFVGRLTTVKKLEMVLQAILLLKERENNFNMTFIGDGEKKNELEVLSKQLGLEDNVWFYGSCYDEKLLGEMIYNADLCVAPGNVGLTAMHTMVFGTPVMTHGDFPHQMPEFEAIIEWKTGAFFEYDSVESLAQTIQKWFIENGKNREIIRQNCFKEIDSNWTPDFQMGVLNEQLSK